MIKSAQFSKDRTKRFELIRDWRDETAAPQTTALWALLNPSKAGEVDNDPTIRKVVGFSRRWGFGRAVVVNLIPNVSTDPWLLPPWKGIDPENHFVLAEWIVKADRVVVAWGTQPSALCWKIGFGEHVYNFRKLASIENVRLFCISLTQNGSPSHPSRIAYTERAEVFEEEV